MVGPSMKPPTTTNTIKFLCSYGGKIIPRYPDGKLRYLGGETRVLAVDRSISFSELLLKLRELCGASVTLRCQLPTEDLDALVSITSDEDLANLIEEYDRASPPPSSLKIKGFLSLPKKISPCPSTASSSSSSSSSSSWKPSLSTESTTPRLSVPQNRKPVVVPLKSAGKMPCCAYQTHGTRFYLIHNGNHWQ